MTTIKPAILLLFLSGFCFSQLNAQSGVSSAGGDSSGETGSVSFSIGLVDYISISNENGSVDQGLQHPYEIFPVTVSEIIGSDLSLIVYPNPTSGIVNLRVEETDLEKLKFRIYHQNGNLIMVKAISGPTTSINLDPLSPGVYVLVVSRGDQPLKEYKIVKH